MTRSAVAAITLRGRPILSRRLLVFTAGSAAGLLIDFGCFETTVRLGAAPGPANVLSSLISILAVYFIVTRRAFAARPRLWSLVAFVSWYGLNIGVTSVAIEHLVVGLGLTPLVAKAVCVPFSFAANYFFNLMLHRAAPLFAARRVRGSAATGQIVPTNSTSASR